MRVKTDLSGLKNSGNASVKPAGVKQWNYSPVWVPVLTDGKAVVNVITRQEFMDKQLGDWRLIQITRVGAILLGVAALYFLGSNVLVAAALGLAAGWAWGLYVRTNYFFETVNKSREILEST